MNNGSISPLAGKTFVVIGAGGAGKALAYGAKEKGAKVIIANRTYGMDFSFNCASIPFQYLMSILVVSKIFSLILLVIFDQ